MVPMRPRTTKRRTEKKTTPDIIVPGAVYLTNEAAALLRVEPATICKAKRLGLIQAHGRPLRMLGSELLKLAVRGIG